MTDFLPVIAVIAGIIAAYLIVLAVRRRNLQRLTERLRAEASARGWTVTSTSRDVFQSIEFRGSTDGIQWIAESLSGWDNSGEQRRRVSTTRWQTSGWHGTAGPIVMLGMTGRADMPAAWPSGDGAVAGLVRTALLGVIDKHIDQHFGQEIAAGIDATRMERVDSAERQLPGYVVMAEHPEEAARAIDRGVGRALVAASDSVRETTAEPEGFFVIVTKQGVGLMRPGAARSLAELDPIVRTGIAIASAVRW